jgi:hypothetical protein
VEADRVVPFAGQEHQHERDRGEQQLHQHVRGQDRAGPQRRRAQALEDASLAVDRDDRDQRQHRAERDQNRGEHGEDDADELAALRVDRAPAPDRPAQQHEDHDGNADSADEPERLADEDLDLEPGEFPQPAQHFRSSSQLPAES